MATTPLLEAMIKKSQDESDMDLLLASFKKVIMMKSPEEIKNGLTAYDNIPNDHCYLFPFLT